MQYRKKLIIKIIAFIFLTMIIATPLADLGRIGGLYNDMPKQGEVLEINELNSFLNLWADIMQKDIANYRSQQLSFSKNNNQDGFPPQLVRWLKQKGWNVNRFFYTEQKIRELANVAYLEQNLEASQQLLETAKQDKAAKANIESIIANQKQQLKFVKANPEELNLIRENLYQINEIIAGRAVLKD